MQKKLEQLEQRLLEASKYLDSAERNARRASEESTQILCSAVAGLFEVLGGLGAAVQAIGLILATDWVLL